jgi:hypothetical protein
MASMYLVSAIYNAPIPLKVEIMGRGMAPPRERELENGPLMPNQEG